MYSDCFVCSVLCIVSLFCSVYCLCVNMYCTVATGCQPIAVKKYIIPYHIISYHIISYHTVSYHIISYHTISYHIIQYHIISYHTISYHTISYHIVSYHIISYITGQSQHRLRRPFYSRRHKRTTALHHTAT